MLPMLNSCFGGDMTPGQVSQDPEWGIYRGQWTTPMSAGKDKWMLRASDTGTAMKGGSEFCSKMSKNVETISLEAGNTQDKKATVLIFSCY